MKAKVLLVLRVVAAIILLQTLYFKFTGAPESIFIFTKMGIEPWGRWFSGIIELVAAALLVLPGTQMLGALISLGVMSGAIMSHLLVLGLVIEDDGGLLFGLACTVFIFSLLVLVVKRDQLKILVNRLAKLILKKKTE
tara:strand:+ start:7682 stop:8095 length:414 start_codon:yes stop_codon:yes gene_type:complete